MARFTGKPTPVAEKLRGGYYTPAPIAEFIASWVAEAGPVMLEPSCGDGTVLAALTDRAGTNVTGVELVAEEARKARARTGATVVHGDFFRWFTEERHAAFDGVAGNPPYIRFGSWDDEYREPALAFMRAVGMRPTRLTNAWVPFVAAAVEAVREGGRVGLVVPAELLQVGYTAELRSRLVDRCAAISVVTFERLVFPGIQQEVALLLAERGQGPAVIRTAEVADAQALGGLDLSGSGTRAALHDSEKWTKYFLPTDAIEALRAVRSDARLSPLGTWADVNVGVVSGRNSFFCMSRPEAESQGLLHLTMPVVTRSAQLRGLLYTKEDLAEHERGEGRTRLLAVDADTELAAEPSLGAYVRLGEAEGVNGGYKCRIRSPWWSVPSVWAPDGFMLRQISSHPRLIANQTGATSTDTVHRVRARVGTDVPRLATAALNSATFALAEVMGRSYGGGILELEPSEARGLPVPDPARVPEGLVSKADELLRTGRLHDALDAVDGAVLVEGLGFSEGEVEALRTAWARLRDRRTTRARSARQ